LFGEGKRLSSGTLLDQAALSLDWRDDVGRSELKEDFQKIDVRNFQDTEKNECRNKREG